MKKVIKVLGIDLGGCMSGNSAYIYAHITRTSFKVIEAFKEPRHKEYSECHHFLLQTIKKFDIDVIAIDAPLSLPAPLLNVHAQRYPREGTGEIINPYLFRYTDYFLFKQFQLRPMPPAGDRIGRLTARAIALLQECSYQMPYIFIQGKRTLIYEVYPKQVAQNLHLKGYKTNPDVLFEMLKIKSFDTDEHLLDALLCAYAGFHIFEGKTVQPPHEALEEGWCYPLQL